MYQETIKKEKKMIFDVEVVCMGDNVYAAKFKHEKLGLLKSIVEANSFSDAKTKINMNMKQCMWKKGVSNRNTPISFNFIAKELNKTQIPYDKTPDDLKQFHPDYIKAKQEQEDPRIWSLEEVKDSNGKSSWRTVKHDSPLMNKVEVQMELMKRMFN